MPGAPKGKPKKTGGSFSGKKGEKKGVGNHSKGNLKPGTQPSKSKKGFGSNDGQGKSRKNKDLDVYEYDGDELTEQQKRDELRRFAGVDVYDYEQPEDFDNDEEIDEDAAFDDDDFERFGDIGKIKKKKDR
jgi:hypothetical protein